MSPLCTPPPLRVTVINDDQDAVRTLDACSLMHGHDLAILGSGPVDREVVLARLAMTEALVCIRERTAIDEDFLSKMPNLRLISQTGKGASHIDVSACTRQGVAVSVGSGNPYAPAELTWALILAASRFLPQHIASNMAGRWQSPMMGAQLKGRTLGIYGYGAIGKIVAGYGQSFGMRVVIWGRDTSLKRAASDGYETAPNAADFFRKCDVVSLHVRLDAGTRGIVTAANLALMKPTAMLVNTSRAELIEPDALAAALRYGRPGTAAVDVYEQEPALNDPLYALPNVICSPHVGYLERDTYEIFFRAAFENILAFENGTPQNILNPEALAR